MLVDPACADSYRVRDVAPDVPVFGNLGARQLVEAGVEAACGLVEAIEADGLFIHLNVAQELVQPGGDRAFAGGLDAIRRLADRLGPKVWVKETGCGLSPSVIRRLVAAGVGGVDVSGAGGTSWTRVEMLRAEGAQRTVGRELSGWGIPTAAAVAATRGLGVPVVASGGVRSGLDVAKALALGASFGGFALPLLKAQAAGGREAVAAELDAVVQTLRATLLLTGCRDVAALQAAPRVLSGVLPAWVAALTESR
jgi:isopentenyl-diphosphate delta-isomerase